MASSGSRKRGRSIYTAGHVMIERRTRRDTRCSSVLQCIAVCCSVLQCAAVCCSVLQCAAACGSVLQRVAVCCSVRCGVLRCAAVCCGVLRCVAVCCSVVGCRFKTDGTQDSRKRALKQCVAVCCSVLQCVAVWLVADSKKMARKTRGDERCRHRRKEGQPYIRASTGLV